jgi:heme exporter protein CcmD
MNEFFAMGGYARYVWPSFGLAVAVLIWNLWAARRYYDAAVIRAKRAQAISSGDAT